MVWNHRVFRTTTPGGTDWYDIREVYYNRVGGRPDSYTAEAIAPGGETIEELRENLQYMLNALDHPVLDKEDIGGNNK